MVFYPYYRLSPNGSYLRIGLGLFALLLIFRYIETDKRYLLMVTGLILGQSFLFSQEVAFCAIITVGSILLLKKLFRATWSHLVREYLFLGMGFIISVAPLLIYFLMNDALHPFFGNMYEYPRLVTLGYGAIPFPDLAEFFRTPMAPLVFDNYWIIFLYILTALYIIPILSLKKVDNTALLILSLFLFGILLFRTALGRASLEQAAHVAPPALLLLMIFLDKAISVISSNKPRLIILGASLSAIGIISFFGVLFTKSHAYEGALHHTLNDIFHIHKKWVRIPMGQTLPQIERAGVQFNPSTAKTLVTIKSFLDKHTMPGEYVYFFPNEAAYYFVFNRNNPTRFAFSYHAVTIKHRLELISDLDKRRPRFLVYSLNTWRVDRIPENIQIPEVVEYINRKYRPYFNADNVVILKRRERSE